MNPNKNFWSDKKVLITGHTGFKGGWLTIWLNQLGANITGVGLEPISTPSLFDLTKIQNICENNFCDIRDLMKLERIVKNCKPDIVFHLAAQPLVRESYKNPIETFSTNIMGTANFLNSLRGICETRVAIMITTDKVYHNYEWVWPYREDDRLGGHDPYSSSKAASELVIDSYRKSYFQHQGLCIGTARAGNVIGGGDWSEDRLIPDAIRSWDAKKVLNIRNPLSKRPWQHVLDPVLGYIILAEKLWDNPCLQGAYNFGPPSQDAATVKEVIEIASKHYGVGETIFNVENEGPHEAGWLSLEVSKAKHFLNVKPRLSLDEAVAKTFKWYKNLKSGGDAFQLCTEDILNFEKKNE